MPSWQFDWCCTIPLLILGAWYSFGLFRLLRHAGIGHGAIITHAVAFAAGWLTVALSILSPLHALGEQMFAAHMTEHELLMILAAPLLVMARPLPIFIWAFSLRTRQSFAGITHNSDTRKFWSWLTQPMTATILQAIALWGWHVPLLFQAALSSQPLHALQHIFFLGTAMLFWWSVLQRNSRLKPGARLLALFVTMVHTTILGVLFTFSRAIWYPLSADPYQICGLSRLQDQQIAGLIMWIPAGMIYVVAGLGIIAQHLKQSSGTRALA